MLMSEHVLKNDWDNEFDERWNKQRKIPNGCAGNQEAD
jgi:hypothetical protein